MQVYQSSIPTSTNTGMNTISIWNQSVLVSLVLVSVHQAAGKKS